ncbi:uncharacterized protein LOC111300172 [Durio zibethinus]|uniref:Uncharacterized protein LOC111300172 n=1 Tax=Durio zibethinus TaxID=66656 RepID=A0A6P5ZGT9_DURZI|nr:uncharacterized protein LOC111300172 [Durio zibethinus]
MIKQFDNDEYADSDYSEYSDNFTDDQFTAFFNTSAAQTIANLLVLPKHFWTKQETIFKTADVNVFSTDFVSNPITLQIFPRCQITQKILGFPLLQKDLVIGFDIITSIPSLKLSGKDDKFFFPDRKTLFTNLANAKWTIILFGLKVVLSLFQKAMTKIFAPILDNTLIYIDDILLFSLDDTSHAQLLNKFQSIIQKYEIMLSKKKMIIRATEIDFLGMHLKDGQYIAQPHIAQSLADFSDENLSKKQIQ